MKTSEHLPKQKNWNDFEELCLRLWGAIWNKEEQIETNSSNDQGQDGVDIFCYLESDQGYVGIQCKNIKDEKLNGTPNNITISAIKKEIEMAEKFIPELKRYIIATSAEKDGKIQEAVRSIDLERRRQGKFPVEIKFWDYIERNVLSHKLVHDWYLKNEHYKTNHSIVFTFDDDSEEISVSPIFTKPVTVYLDKKPTNPLEGWMELSKRLRSFTQQKEFNRSFVKVKFKIKNNGDQPIENWKIKLTFDENIHDLSKTNIVEGTFAELVSRTIPSLYINKNPLQATFTKNSLKGDMLVKNDEFFFEELFIKPKPIQGLSIITLNWELLSKNYHTSGKLTLSCNTTFRRRTTEIVVDNSVGELPIMKVGEIEDYISPYEND